MNKKAQNIISIQEEMISVVNHSFISNILPKSEVEDIISIFINHHYDAQKNADDVAELLAADFSGSIDVALQFSSWDEEILNCLVDQIMHIAKKYADIISPSPHAYRKKP